MSALGLISVKKLMIIADFMKPVYTEAGTLCVKGENLRTKMNKFLQNKRGQYYSFGEKVIFWSQFRQKGLKLI
jgi:hypothetical protein